MDDLLRRLEIPGIRQSDADVHHRRLDDQCRELIRVAAESRIERLQIVEGDDRHQIDEGPRDAFALRD